MGINFGVSLYSVAKEMQKDYLGTLEKVAEIGYKYIEFANHSFGSGFKGEASPVKLKNRLDECGLTPVSSHIWPIPNSWDETIDYYSQVGIQYLVVPMGYMATYDDVMKMAELCNNVGKKCRENGMGLCYHNHYQEFLKINGKYVIDLLMENTDPQYVYSELDTYWTMRGGANPVEVIEKLGDRCKLLHQKDLPEGVSPVNVFEGIKGEITSDAIKNAFRDVVKSTDFVEIGTGTMNIKSIYEKAKEVASVQYIIVEQDHTKLEQLDSIKVSYENIKNIVL
jgi:sugar phosphate isomerase/epimerase